MSLGMSDDLWDNYYLLLSAGANINQVSDGATVAEFAAALGRFDKVLELLDRGYNGDLEDLGGLIESRYIPPEDQALLEARRRVELKLKQLGVHFPIRPGIERHPMLPVPSRP